MKTENQIDYDFAKSLNDTIIFNKKSLIDLFELRDDNKKIIMLIKEEIKNDPKNKKNKKKLSIIKRIKRAIKNLNKCINLTNKMIFRAKNQLENMTVNELHHHFVDRVDKSRQPYDLILEYADSEEHKLIMKKIKEKTNNMFEHAIIFKNHKINC